ncbi:MAG: aminotransferase class I/II-fold pyridoxal phosphate-dependent enzyme, partial [Beijerinckiaceae bacterium]
TLKPPHWRFTADDLAEAFSPRTKLVLFNNPLNPSGIVYARDDLELLAQACIANDAIAVCDEVWEHVIFDDRAHLPLIALPGMRERTVKIGSAGKIFSLTGWKVGFVCAAAPLMRVLAKAHQFLTFTTPPNLQAAAAYGLMKDDAYFTQMRAAFQRSRDRFAAGLSERGFAVLPSAGTYFLNVDLAPLGVNDDTAFCERLVKEHGVAAIPVSAFYAQDAVKTVARFCFAKTDATLDAALHRLENVARHR